MPTYNFDDNCSRCNSRMSYQAIIVHSSRKKLIEGRCPICSNRHYPEFEQRPVIVVDFEKNKQLYELLLDQASVSIPFSSKDKVDVRSRRVDFENLAESLHELVAKEIVRVLTDRLQIETS